MLDEVIGILTEQMIKTDFEDKQNNKKSVVAISKVDLYKFGIKLIKLIKQEFGE